MGAILVERLQPGHTLILKPLAVLRNPVISGFAMKIPTLFERVLDGVL